MVYWFSIIGVMILEIFVAIIYSVISYVEFDLLNFILLRIIQHLY